ncbi:hypothetical protein PSTG_19230 [Puccinia striiformis f. sp. tritici PST-78]|uniref:F-box domain-containing protein n=1 Tax=Puccinia striiformis f. sp. tritici PST-78 TaxID=1165861 RepID=A0A0L0UKB0_9BASI|nr:hypothetical protein PSTG_19230 [Puccinia striiformis f. sp. tritici PST-78]
MREFRLVCRRWSNLITDRHLYQTLVFRRGTRAMQFINPQKASLRLPFSDVRPKCQVLAIDRLWTCGAPLVRDYDMLTPLHLVELVELFKDTIVELELEFTASLWLPTSTIQAIGRIKNLHTLRLSYDQERTHISSSDEEEIGRHHDPDFSAPCFRQLKD